MSRTGTEDLLRHPYSDKRHSNFIDKDTTWTIGTTGGTTFASISSAFNYIKLNNVIVSPGKTLTLKVNDGYIAKEQILIENMNLSGVVLQSDSTISVDLRGLTLKTLDGYRYFIGVTESTALIIKAKFDFTISKTTVADVSGVIMHNSSDIRIENSTFSNFSKTGVYARFNTTLELSACTLIQNANSGITVANGSSANMYNCTANSNAVNGILVAFGASANMDTCTFNSNTANGVAVMQGASANIYSCTANSNTSGIYVVRGASANVCTTNGQKTIGTDSDADFVCINASLLTLSECTGGQNLTPGTATAAGLILRFD